MKVAVIGSRELVVTDLEKYLPSDVTEIVSGGARGVDRCAENYAAAHGIAFTEFLPEYEKYRRAAPFKRNLQIVEYTDEVMVFWNGSSRGTKNVIDNCEKLHKKVTVYKFTENADNPWIKM